MKKPLIFEPMAQGTFGEWLASQKSKECEHQHYSTSANECGRHKNSSDCYVNTCDNCNAVVGHVSFKPFKG